MLITPCRTHPPIKPTHNESTKPRATIRILLDVCRPQKGAPSSTTALINNCLWRHKYKYFPVGGQPACSSPPDGLIYGISPSSSAAAVSRGGVYECMYRRRCRSDFQLKHINNFNLKFLAPREDRALHVPDSSCCQPAGNAPPFPHSCSPLCSSRASSTLIQNN